MFYHGENAFLARDAAHCVHISLTRRIQVAKYKFLDPARDFVFRIT
jgi:hypothetical protein